MVQETAKCIFNEFKCTDRSRVLGFHPNFKVTPELTRDSIQAALKEQQRMIMLSIPIKETFQCLCNMNNIQTFESSNASFHKILERFTFVVAWFSENMQIHNKIGLVSKINSYEIQ